MRSMGVHELATSSTGAGSSESAESSEGTGGGCVVPTRLMGGCEPAFSLADARAARSSRCVRRKENLLPLATSHVTS